MANFILRLPHIKLGAVIHVIDAALPPNRKSSPRRALIVNAVTALGFFLSSFSHCSGRALDAPRGTQIRLEKLRCLSEPWLWEDRAQTRDTMDPS
jgi:hypothetical protein